MFNQIQRIMKNVFSIIAMIFFIGFAKANVDPPRYDVEDDRIFVVDGSGQDLEVAIVDLKTLKVVNLERSKMNVTAFKVIEDGESYSVAIVTKIGDKQFKYISEKIGKDPGWKDSVRESNRKHNQDLINRINGSSGGKSRIR